MPPENIVALFDTAKEYGIYPIDDDRIDARLEELITVKPDIREHLPV